MNEFLADHNFSLSMVEPVIGLITAVLILLLASLVLRAHNQGKKFRDSQALNRAVLFHGGSTIIAVDLEGIVLVFNPAAEQVLGYSSSEIIGKHTPAIWHDHNEVEQHAAALSKEVGYHVAPGFEALVFRAKRDGAEGREWTYIRKDGSRFTGFLTVTPLRDGKGTLIGYVGIGQDITQQKEQQQALKTSEETFRTAMEGAAIGMALVAPNGSWLRVNDALCSLLDYDREVFLKTNVQKLTYPEDMPQSLNNIQLLLSGKVQSFASEKRYLHSSGRPVWVQLNVTLVRHNDGTPNYMIAQIQDITGRKELDHVKSEFISVVSHELRTPLTSIRGSLGLISGALSKDLPPQIVQLINIAYKNSERLILLINDILDMDKIAAGQMRFDMKAESLALLMRQAVDANRAYAQEFDVDIFLEKIPPELTISVDTSRFIQVLSNLLSNAAKFSHSHTAIRVTTAVHNGKVRISVKDNGPGIPDEFRTRIFGKFLQADSSVRREKGGTGLGLHITREIVVHMGGQIGFDSTAGKGATFWIEFPVSSVGFIPPAISMSNLIVRDPDMIGRRVLVCEDSEAVAEILKKQIEAAGFTVDVALTIADARFKLRFHDYVAMTLDITFPEENGMDFIAELRADRTTANLAIVVVSATAEENRQNLKGDAVGILGWLTKPLDAEKLITALRRASEIKPLVLHVEDDRDLSNVLSTALGDRAELINAPTLQEARQHLQNKSFALIILDIALPDGNGLALLSELDEWTGRPVPVLILSANEPPPDIQLLVGAAMVKSRMSETRVVETILSLIKSNESGIHAI